MASSPAISTHENHIPCEHLTVLLIYLPPTSMYSHLKCSLPLFLHGRFLSSLQAFAKPSLASESVIPLSSVLPQFRRSALTSNRDFQHGCGICYCLSAELFSLVHCPHLLPSSFLSLLFFPLPILACPRQGLH